MSKDNSFSLWWKHEGSLISIARVYDERPDDENMLCEGGDDHDEPYDERFFICLTLFVTPHVGNI